MLYSVNSSESKKQNKTESHSILLIAQEKYQHSYDTLQKLVPTFKEKLLSFSPPEYYVDFIEMTASDTCCNINAAIISQLMLTAV